MQTCDRYPPITGAPRDLLKPNRRRSQRPENRSKGAVIPYFPLPSLLKLSWRESALSHTNGYSIAEILLVFGIIAGVLVGVWAMYTLLGNKVDAQTAIVEIQMIRDAAVQYRNLTNKYNYLDFPSSKIQLTPLASYLGQSGLADGQNIFGEQVHTYPSLPRNTNLDVSYGGVPSLDICRQILNNFGVVQDFPSIEAIDIHPGDTISGYIGSSWGDTGCERVGGSFTLSIIVD